MRNEIKQFVQRYCGCTATTKLIMSFRLPMIALTLLGVAACSENGHSDPKSAQLSAPAVDRISSAASAVAGSAVPATNTPAMGLAAPAANHHIGVASLGTPFKQLLSQVSHDTTEERDGYLWVSKSGEVLLGLSDKNDLQDKIAWQIIIVSPRVVTDGGVYVGMPIKDLLQKFPGTELELGEDDAEIFAPAELEKGTSENPDAGILIYVAAKDGTGLPYGSVGDDGHVKQFSTDGVVTHIVVLAGGNRPK